MVSAPSFPRSPAAVSVGAACAHCGTTIGAEPIRDESGRVYCCTGCSSVATLLRENGLDRKYYDLRGCAEPPVAFADPSRRDLAWLEPLAAQLADGAVGTVTLDAQGLHCTACVWLLEQLFRRTPGGIRLVVDPSIGRIEIWAHKEFDLRGYVREVERFGYVVGPSTKKPSEKSDALLVRTAVTVALAMNAMTFALALYLGLSSGLAATAARVLESVLAAAAVAVGAPPILSSAWASLRARMLSLDVPIALGIVLAGTSTAVSVIVHHDPGYADTLAVFVALMLVGRWLTERTLRKDRDRLLEDPGVDGLYARRIDASGTHVVRASSIAKGDRLALGPGEVVPVAAQLDVAGTFSLEWISGEPEARLVAAGEVLPAGAVHVTGELVTMRAQEDFASSALKSLLMRPSERQSHASSFWERIARWYVGLVLGLAAVTFAGWWLATGDLAHALDTTTALLVVTCPCGLGIATPLAYTLALGILRRRGLFVRRADLLDRAGDVRRIVFDKTGTLTTGRSHLVSTRSLEALSRTDRAKLVGLARASSHPASAAIARETKNEPAVVLEDVHEVVGAGVEGRSGASVVRLGRADWAAPSEWRGIGGLVFSVDGHVRARFALEETLRQDARSELEGLAARGLELRVLSGDDPSRVARVAEQVGIAQDHAEGGASPEEKAERIAELDRHDTMFVGDGLNDTLAISRAFVSGTPSIERPFVPGRADFYFVTAGLAPIRALFVVAARVRAVARTNLTIAVLYNGIAVTLAMAGMMRPWLAAILMPLSSIALVTLARVRMQEASWTR
ncbi:MAG: heavy metal translocating P-type ATPase metal-binding domain-containing protein [Sandaracinus sp.]